MFGFVLDGLREDGREGVDSIQLIIWDDHEEGKERFPDGKQVIIRWFPVERGKVSYASLKRRVMASGVMVR